MRKKKNLEARLLRCAPVTIEQPEEYKGRWRDIKPDATAIFIEIGCGKGQFSIEMAKRHPDVLYIALEREQSAVLLAMEKAVSLHLHNIYFIVGDAASIPLFFSSGELDRLYLNFSDPWTRGKRYKRRLTYRAFLQLYIDIAAPGANIYVKTDNTELFLFTVSELITCGFSICDITHDLHKTKIENIMTEYETRFTNEGLPIYRVEATFPEKSTVRQDSLIG